jgi:hypothetical protein
MFIFLFGINFQSVYFVTGFLVFQIVKKKEQNSIFVGWIFMDFLVEKKKVRRVCRAVGNVVVTLVELRRFQLLLK